MSATHEKMRLGDLPVIVAHRGYSAAHPENTPLSFAAALDAGARVLETDLRLSADGVVVCVHDDDLWRLSGTKRKVTETRWDELRNLHRIDGGRFHRFEDLLATANGAAYVLLDVKEPVPALFEAVLAAADNALMTGNVIFGLRRKDDIDLLRRIRPDAQVCALLPSFQETRQAADNGEILVRLWERWVDAQRVEDLQRSGTMVWVTTGGQYTNRAPGDISPAGAAALIRSGIDGMLVNDPGLIRRNHGEAAE